MAETTETDDVEQSIDVSNDLTAERTADGWVTIRSAESGCAVEAAPVEIADLRHSLEELDPNHEHGETYLCLGPHGWGKGSHETEAVANAAPHLRLNGDTVEVTIIRCRGYRGHELLPHGVSVKAEEVISEETLAVDTDDLREVSDRATEVEIAAESALVDADDVDDETDD